MTYQSVFRMTFFFALCFSAAETLAMSSQVKEQCDKLPDMRATLLEFETLTDSMRLRLADAGMPASLLDEQVKAMEEQRINIERLTEICASVRKQASTFVAGLHGFEPLPFFNRLQQFANRHAALDSKLAFTEEHRQRLFESGKSMMKSLSQIAALLADDNPVKRAQLAIDIIKATNDAALVLVDAMGVDVKDIHDADTLFERLEARAQELRLAENTEL